MPAGVPAAEREARIGGANKPIWRLAEPRQGIAWERASQRGEEGGEGGVEGDVGEGGGEKEDTSQES